jgi:hypothetical protein
MEPRFGHDFSRVRVHADAKAAESARAVNARAYTVGRSVVFGGEQVAPGTPAGRMLLAHELAHVVQQGDQRSSPVAIGEPGDALERQADRIAAAVLRGATPSEDFRPAPPAIQRDETHKTPPAPPPDKTADTITGGLKTVAEQAKDNNPAVKQKILDPLQRRAEQWFDRQSTGEKAAVVGFGGLTYSLALTAFLSDAAGRKYLSDLPIGAPLALIPYFPLTSFKYTLPDPTNRTDPTKRLLTFETGFSATDYIKELAGTSVFKDMTLDVTMKWGVDPASNHLSVVGADAKLGLLPGVAIQGGLYQGLLPLPNIVTAPTGERVESKQSLPEPDGGKKAPVPDARVMLTVDLMKFNPAVVRRIPLLGGLLQ